MTLVDGIRARETKASPGPWTAEPHSHVDPGCRCLSCHSTPTGWLVSNAAAADCESSAARSQTTAPGCSTGPLLTFEDAEFAAHARTDIPALLARLDAAERGAIAAWKLVRSLRCDVKNVIDALRHGQEQKNLPPSEKELFSSLLIVLGNTWRHSAPAAATTPLGDLVVCVECGTGPSPASDLFHTRACSRKPS